MLQLTSNEINQILGRPETTEIPHNEQLLISAQLLKVAVFIMTSQESLNSLRAEALIVSGINTNNPEIILLAEQFMPVSMR